MNSNHKIILGYCGLIISFSSVFFGLLIRDYNLILSVLTTVTVCLFGGILSWFMIFRESNNGNTIEEFV